MRRLAAAAVIAGSAATVWAAVPDLPVTDVNGSQYYYREVQPKETVYSICRELGLSKGELVRFNPAVADGLKAGMTLYFPVSEFGEPVSRPAAAPQKASGETAAAPARPATQADIHLVEKGETVYGVARHYGITEEELIAANPQLARGMKAGTILHIPVPAVNPSATQLPDTPDYTPAAPVEPVAEVVPVVPVIPAVSSQETGSESLEQEEPDAVEEADGETEPAETPEEATAEEPRNILDAPVRPDTVRVALLLPFMLSEETPDKQAQLFTEFYKGFLLAADSLKNMATVPMVISAYDTAGNNDTVRSILDSPAFAGTNVIITSDSDAQLALADEWVRANGALVLNIFAVRNDLYRTSPAVLQANIPHLDMYEKAAGAFLHEFPGFTPVIVSSKNGRHDKDEFIEVLRRRAIQAGLTPVDIDYEGLLKESDLSVLDANEGRYVFVTTSGNPTEFNRIMPAIKVWRDALPDFNSARLFGYPEWITFRGDALQNLHYMNAVVYSRFYDDETSPRSRDAGSQFLAAYGRPMLTAVPRQGLLGFDTGCWLINTINTYGHRRELSFDGVQTGFHFVEHPDAQGKVNDVLYLINFRPSGLVNKTSID